jgi:putative glutamine amidotransferase
VDRVAKGFQVVARAPDGIIEAMEKTDARFFCAVQFHPERLTNVVPAFQKLFWEFVKACRRR